MTPQEKEPYERMAKEDELRYLKEVRGRMDDSEIILQNENPNCPMYAPAFCILP